MNFNAKPFFNRNSITFEFVQLQKLRKRIKGRKLAILRKDNLFYLYTEVTKD